MYGQVISEKTKRLLAALAQSGVIKDFYLAGGTALALQYGHRKSIDLDLFKQAGFRPVLLKRQLSQLGVMELESEDEGTLNISLDKIKLSFFKYPYKLLFPLIKWQYIQIADERDIACMKLDAVSSRGSKKDFIDLYFLSQKYKLSELLDFFQQKYKNIKYNQLHILKSLNYFKDADKEIMPVMLKDISWPDIKKYFQELMKNEFK